MKNTEFNALLRTVSTKGRLDPVKARKLTSDERHATMLHIVRRRQPLAACLMPDQHDDSWLNAMGYLYRSTSPTTGLEFRHTCEHFIK